MLSSAGSQLLSCMRPVLERTPGEGFCLPPLHKEYSANLWELLVLLLLAPVQLASQRLAAKDLGPMQVGRIH